MSVITREEVSTVVGGTVGTFTVRVEIIDGVIKGPIKISYTPQPSMVASEHICINDVEDARDLVHILNETITQLSKVSKK